MCYHMSGEEEGSMDTHTVFIVTVSAQGVNYVMLLLNREKQS